MNLEYEMCPDCQEYGWSHTHECDPVHLVLSWDWLGEEEQAADPEVIREDGREIFAKTPKDAAEIYMIQFHSDMDYPQEQDMIVLSPENGISYWTVTARLEPVFEAAEKGNRK